MSRKLDAAIAEALGYEVEWKDFPSLQPSEIVRGELITKIPVFKDSWIYVPRYSDSGNAMLELDAEMRRRKRAVMITNHEGKHIVFYDNVGIMGTADTMPKAVALAAYKALTGREWVE